MRISNCRSCLTSIVWLKTKAGKNMPVDFSSIAIGSDPVEFDAEAGHISHFATCPKADDHRRRK